MPTLHRTLQITNLNYGKDRIIDLTFGLLLILISTYFLSGIQLVPFHPDESTQLYMSRDLDTLFSDPSELVFNPSSPVDEMQTYRLLDAPLARYVLGIGRIIAGQPALSIDWNWSASWSQNDNSGAVPSNKLLYGGRAAVTLLLIFSLIIIYLGGKKFSGPWVGLISALLLATNALVLLHGRRAMAEGGLIFGVSLVIFLLFQTKRKPWLLGLAVALAFNAKQSSIGLLPVGMLAILLPDKDYAATLRDNLVSILQFFLSFAVITFLLNPYLWAEPWSASLSAWNARQDLLTRQVETFRLIAPQHVLDTHGERLGVILAQLYIAPLSFAEIGNYLLDTAPGVKSYLSHPGHRLFNNVFWGAVLLTLSLFGLVTSFMRGKLAPEKKNALLLLLTFVFQLFVLVVTVPLPFQRYVIPLIPPVCIWAAFGFVKILSVLQTRDVDR